MTEHKNSAAHPGASNANASTTEPTAQERLREGFEDAKSRAGAVYDNARDKAAETAHRTAEAAEANPLGVVAGGIALGALVAAVLPRSARERELLAPVGKRVTAAATAAIAAAKAAGKEELDSMGLTPGAAKGQVKSLLQGLGQAAKSAGKAAADAGREEARSGG